MTDGVWKVIQHQHWYARRGGQGAVIHWPSCHRQTAAISTVPLRFLLMLKFFSGQLKSLSSLFPSICFWHVLHIAPAHTTNSMFSRSEGRGRKIGSGGKTLWNCSLGKFLSYATVFHINSSRKDNWNDAWTVRWHYFYFMTKSEKSLINGIFPHRHTEKWWALGATTTHDCCQSTWQMLQNSVE